jgi:hypothetical protein
MIGVLMLGNGLGLGPELLVGTSANCEGAIVRDIDLSGAQLRGANLTRSDLRGSDLTTLEPCPVTLAAP